MKTWCGDIYEELNSNTAAVILYLKQLQTTIFDGNFNLCRASIETVLDQLFQRRGRPVDDLSSFRARSVVCAENIYKHQKLTSPAAIRFTNDSWRRLIGSGADGGGVGERVRAGMVIVLRFRRQCATSQILDCLEGRSGVLG